MNLDHYLTLGASGLRVSPLCLGTMTFGEDWGWGSDVETSTKVLDAYIDKGGNFIDTANIYTNGHSEKIIGDHIGCVPSRRDRLVIATKFMGNLYLGDAVVEKTDLNSAAARVTLKAGEIVVGDEADEAGVFLNQFAFACLQIDAMDVVHPFVAVVEADQNLQHRHAHHQPVGFRQVRASAVHEG